MQRGIKGILPVLAATAMDCVGAGLILPVGPRIISAITGQPLGTTSVTYAALVASYSMAQFLFAPLMGRLSDRYGRRPILIVALLGLAFNYFIFATANQVWILFAARIAAGAFGASFSAAAAYVSDSTSQEDRATGFGLMGAAAGAGIVIGPLLGGLLGSANSRLPFFVAGGLAALNSAFVFGLLPESLSETSRRAFRLREANPVSSLLRFRKFPVLRQLALSLFFFEISNMILPTIWVIYAIDHLGWSPFQVGLSFVLMGVMQVAVQGGLTRVFVRLIGDYGTLLLGGSLIMFGFLLAAFAHTTATAYATLFILTCGWIAGPATNSLISKQVEDSEQGELQGAMRSLESVGTMLGPPIAGSAYAVFSASRAAEFPGAPLLLGAVLVLVALLCASPAIYGALARKNTGAGASAAGGVPQPRPLE